MHTSNLKKKWGICRVQRAYFETQRTCCYKFVPPKNKIIQFLYNTN